MDRFYSTADMIEQYVRSGWNRRPLGYGFCLTPPAHIGSGHFTCWGDPETYCFIDSDIVFHKEVLERFYVRKKGIQISFIEDITADYYQKKDEMKTSRSGTFFHINNYPAVWFHRIPAGKKQRVYSLMIDEPFASAIHIEIPDLLLDQMARTFNGRTISLPAIASVCRQIKGTSVEPDVFPAFFKAKTMEAVSLMIDYTEKQSTRNIPGTTSKSRNAASRVRSILDHTYADPPVIETLAREEGIDKKTLQSAFRHMTGQTIGAYLCSIRMEKALTLLEDNDKTIEAIAHETGYHSKINFYNAIKKTYGCTPGELRRQIQ